MTLVRSIEEALDRDLLEVAEERLARHRDRFAKETIESLEGRIEYLRRYLADETVPPYEECPICHGAEKGCETCAGSGAPGYVEHDCEGAQERGERISAESSETMKRMKEAIDRG